MLVVHKLMMPEKEKRLPANSPWSDDEPPARANSGNSLGERQKNSLDAELLGVNRLAFRCKPFSLLPHQRAVSKRRIKRMCAFASQPAEA
jgi:hypothetical protein